MEILGYISAVFIGLSLGLTGSGGSILTVPILVYLIGLSPVMATSYSLFVVGATSSIGGIRFYRKGQVHLKSLFSFGVPSLLTIYLTRLFLVPALPNELLQVGAVVVTKSGAVMVLFAVLMVLAAYRMIHHQEIVCQEPAAEPQVPYARVITQAVLVGLISGLVGAGGGFLIIPALVLLLRLDMKTAVGTSLVLIAGNSLVGFLGDMVHYSINWTFLLTFSALSVGGIYLGSAFAHQVNSRALKKGFGWFVLAMGIFILAKEIFL
ncbi:sulfite exporter TauE/SafE family protein [Rufibacter sediminis]|uniref:Probable membrane transporter protein n=1 Tax=Rufibacter sediminis TaxID=2762756 RepID=A0ABR6VNB0_9BACT|nr:sulfite exporter TauE/SafE family protein [Rufibacter sediminis]MBC3538630.1 sulfite exporter TauE/SafE family protein [Rufibacter sediminis]